jgi:hypothetical protein
MVWKEARRSLTSELRWYQDWRDDSPRLQQKILIEGTEDDVWVYRYDWEDVKLVRYGGE